MVFMGGAVLANIMKDKESFWLSRAEYEENGLKVLDKLGAALRWEAFIHGTSQTSEEYSSNTSYHKKYSYILKDHSRGYYSELKPKPQNIFHYLN